MSIDITRLVIIWIVGGIVMIPLIGVTARFGLVPLLEAIGRARQGSEGGALVRRLREVEARVEELSGTVDRMSEDRRHAPLH